MRTMNPEPVVEELDTAHCGTLHIGDEFKFQPGGPGTEWGWFNFHGIATRRGSWVRAYGGDPLREKFAHARQWRAFDVEAVVSGAKPPFRRRRQS